MDFKHECGCPFTEDEKTIYTLDMSFEVDYNETSCCNQINEFELWWLEMKKVIEEVNCIHARRTYKILRPELIPQLIWKIVFEQKNKILKGTFLDESNCFLNLN